MVESVIPNFPKIKDIFDIYDIRTTISPNKDFIIFDNYKGDNSQTNDDINSESKNYILIFDIKNRKSYEINLEEDVDRIFPQFDDRNNIVISYKKGTELTHHIYNPKDCLLYTSPSPRD